MQFDSVSAAGVYFYFRWYYCPVGVGPPMI